MKIAHYEDLLEPYLVKAFAGVDWPDSFTGRLLIAVRLYKNCADRVAIDHDVIDTRERSPDIVAIINRLVPDADQA